MGGVVQEMSEVNFSQRWVKLSKCMCLKLVVIDRVTCRVLNGAFSIEAASQKFPPSS